MVDIPNGAVATWTGTLSTQGALSTAGAAFLGTFNPQQEIAVLNQELVFDGLTIANYSVDNSISAAFTGSANVTLQILNQSGQDLDDSDLAAQLQDAVNTVLPSRALVGGVTSVSSPAGGTGTNTGSGKVSVTPLGAAVAASAPASGGTKQCGDPSLTFFSDPGQWITCLTQKGLSTLGLLFIGLLVGVVLIVASEHRRA